MIEWAGISEGPKIGGIAYWGHHKGWLQESALNRFCADPPWISNPGKVEPVAQPWGTDQC